MTLAERPEKAEREKPKTRPGHCPDHGPIEFVLMGGAYVCPDPDGSHNTSGDYKDELPRRSGRVDR